MIVYHRLASMANALTERTPSHVLAIPVTQVSIVRLKSMSVNRIRVSLGALVGISSITISASVKREHQDPIARSTSMSATAIHAEIMPPALMELTGKLKRC